MPADLKLWYFDIRGRAEMIRLMLAAAGKEYEEERIPFGGPWPQIKPSECCLQSFVCLFMYLFIHSFLIIVGGGGSVCCFCSC